MCDYKPDTFSVCGSFTEGMMNMSAFESPSPGSEATRSSREGGDSSGESPRTMSLTGSPASGDPDQPSPVSGEEDSSLPEGSPDAPSGDPDTEGENYGLAKIEAVMKECQGDPYAKPGLSYIALISLAIQNSPDQRLLLADIYNWIVENFPYYSGRDRSWRNSVRHNLSLNECFIKTGRADNGKGNYWAVHPACSEDFLRGDFRRRRARRRVRHCNDQLERLHLGVMSTSNFIKEELAEAEDSLASSTFVPMTCMTASTQSLVSIFGAEAILGRKSRDTYTGCDSAEVNSDICMKGAGLNTSAENSDFNTQPSSCMFGAAVPFLQQTSPVAMATNVMETSDFQMPVCYQSQVHNTSIYGNNDMAMALAPRSDLVPGFLYPTTQGFSLPAPMM